MSITIPSKPLIPQQSLYSLDIRSAISGLRGGKEPWGIVAGMFDQIQSSNNRLEKAIRSASDNTFNELIIRDSTGKLIGWIGSRPPYSGAWFQQLYVGGDGPDTAPFFADVNGDVIIGVNGSLAIQDGGGNEVGWLGVQNDAPAKTITGATNATPIVITSNAHGFENGDTVLIASVLGNTAANGYRIVKNKAVNTFEITDLAGVNVAGSGAYTSGGTALRYFGGGRFQTIAVGTSFTNYKLRAYADGQLKIKDALITLTDAVNNGYIELNPSGPVAKFRNTLTGSQTQIFDGGITLDNYITPAESLVISYVALQILNAASDVNVNIASSFGAGQISVSDNTGSGTIGLSGATGIVSCFEVNASTNVEGGAYSVGGVPGVTDSGTYVTNVSFSTDSAVNSVDFGGMSTTSITVVTGLTITTVSRAWTSGLLTT